MSVFNTHVLPHFGQAKLSELTRFELQAHLNELAGKKSQSIVHKSKNWLKAALDEAVEQEYLAKNPARKLGMPCTRPTCKRYLSEDQIPKLLSAVEGRDRLIVRLLLLCALRPGELFALRARRARPSSHRRGDLSRRAGRDENRNQQRVRRLARHT